MPSMPLSLHPSPHVAPSPFIATSATTGDGIPLVEVRDEDGGDDYADEEEFEAIESTKAKATHLNESQPTHETVHDPYEDEIEFEIE